MNTFKNKTVIITYKRRFLSIRKLVYFFILLILTVYNYFIFCHAEESTPESQLTNLEAKSEEYFSQNKYEEFIAEIGKLKDALPQEQHWNIDYYLALAKMEYLVFLEKREDWKKYFSLKEEYLNEIEKTADKLANTFADKKLGLESQYLLSKIYRHKEEPTQESQALKKLDLMLVNYLRQTKDADTLKVFAERLYQEGKTEEAKALFESFVSGLERAGEREKVASRLKTIADGYFKNEKFDISSWLHKKYLEFILREYPLEFIIRAEELVTMYYGEAKKYVLQYGTYGKGDMVTDALLEMNEFILTQAKDRPEADKIWYIQALVLKKIHKVAEAIKLLEEFLEKYSRSKIFADVLGELAGNYYIISHSDAEIDTAIAKLKELIKRYPVDMPFIEYNPFGSTMSKLYETLGDLHKKKGDYLSAIEQYKEIFTKYPPRVIWDDLKEAPRECAAKLNKPELADFVTKFEQKQAEIEKQKQLERKREIQKHAAFMAKAKSDTERREQENKAKELYGQIMFKPEKGFLPQVVEKYEELIQKYPENERNYLFSIINAYLLVQEFSAGEKYAERLISLSPQTEPEYLVLLKFYFLRKEITGLSDKDELIEEVAQKLIAVAPNSAQAYSQLADLYFLQGKSEQAEKNLEKAKSLDAGIEIYSNMVRQQKSAKALENGRVVLLMGKDGEFIDYYVRTEPEKFSDVKQKQLEIYKNKNLSYPQKAEEFKLLIEKIVKTFPAKEQSTHRLIYEMWDKVFSAANGQFMAEGRTVFKAAKNYQELLDGLQKISKKINVQK